MAVNDYNNLTSITREKIFPSVISQVRRSMPILDKLMSKAERVSGGLEIHQPVKFAIGTRGGSYSGLGPLNTSRETTRTRAKFPWSQYHWPIVLSNIERAKNGSPEGIVDLVAQDLMEAKEDLQDRLGTHLWESTPGNGGLNFLGIPAGVDDGTNAAVYGDITRSGNDWWKSYYDGSVGALTLAKLRTAHDAVSGAGSENPDLHAVGQVTKSYFEQLVAANLQYQVQGAGRAEPSPLELTFRGAPVVADEKVPAGYWYMLNTNYLKWFYLNHPDYPTRNDGFAVSDMRVPTDQDGKVGFIFSYFQLVNTQPRRMAALRGVTAPS